MVCLCNPICVSLLLACMIQGLISNVQQKAAVCCLCADTRADIQTTELFAVDLTLMYQSQDCVFVCECSLSGQIMPLRPAMSSWAVASPPASIENSRVLDLASGYPLLTSSTHIHTPTRFYTHTQITKAHIVLNNRVTLELSLSSNVHRFTYAY